MHTSHPDTHRTGDVAPRHLTGTGHWRRLAGVGLVATMMSVTTVSAGAAVRSTSLSSTSGTSGIRLTDWSQYGWSDYGQGQFGQSQSGQGQLGQSYGQSPYGESQQDPWSSSGSTATVNSDPATKAESAGVAIIDTVLGYQDAAAAGTGIVLTSNGEILTNYHVVEGATSIKVTIATTGKTYTATVVGDDQTDDVALLKLKGASGLTTATIDDDTVSKGDKVTAVGNAGGTSSLTAAAGTVTSLSESITTESEATAAGETLHGLIATDADVVPGDSGGPLLDHENEVVGIDTAASSGSVINGYAIPIDTALSIVKQIRSGHETSTVSIGRDAFLGVEVSADQSSSSSASSGPGQSDGLGNGLSDGLSDGFSNGWNDGLSDGQGVEISGAVVAGVIDQSPASEAGVTAGDVITAIGGTTIGSASDLTTALQKYQPKDHVKLTWTDTDGSSHTKTVTLAASPVA